MRRKTDEEKRATKRAYYLRNRERLLAWHKEHYAENADTKRAKSAAYRASNPHAQYKFRIKRLYGLTQAEYDAMLKAQGGKCAICEEPPKHTTGPNSAQPPRLHVDHCHVTGKVRALLCQKCNRGLGCFADNTAMLIKAHMYLLRHFHLRLDVPA